MSWRISTENKVFIDRATLFFEGRILGSFYHPVDQNLRYFIANLKPVGLSLQNDQNVLSRCPIFRSGHGHFRPHK